MSRRRNSEVNPLVTGGNREMGYYVPRSYWASRLAPYAIEWGGLCAALLAGGGAWWWLGDSAALPWITPALTLIGTGLSGVTWIAAKARGLITRVHATATVGAGTAWMVACSVAGPFNTPMMLVWTFVGGALCLSWNIRRALSSGSDGNGGEFFEKVKLAGLKAAQVQAAPNKVSAQLQLPAGEMTVEDVQKAGDRITGALRLHKGAVRIVGDPEDMSRATMTVVPVDVLRHPQPWPGPSHPGGSIADPIVTGLYEDNEPEQFYLPGDKATQRNATHIQVVGMNGSGKTHGGKLAWTEILTRRDVCLVVLDPVKGKQSVSFLGEDSAHVITGEKACKAFMRRIPAMIAAHADLLGEWGYDQWTPEVYRKHGLPYMVFWVEEAPRVLEDADTLTKIAEALRSAGGSLVLSLQKASFRRMNTDVRSQMGGAWCFGVNAIEDAGFSLSDDLIEAGARPDQWKNRRPGCNYLESAGVPEERHIVPARTFDSEDTEMRRVIDNAKPIRAALHEVTARVLGLPQQPGIFASPDEAPDPAEPARSFTAGTDGDVWMNEPLSDEDDQNLMPLPDDPEPDLEGTADDEIPAHDPGMVFPQGRPTRAECRRMLGERIEQITRAGKTEFTVRDLPDPEQAFGRGRPWLSGELARLAREGALVAVSEDARATVYTLAGTPAHAHAA